MNPSETSSSSSWKSGQKDKRESANGLAFLCSALASSSAEPSGSRLNNDRPALTSFKISSQLSSAPPI